ncbi:MAG: 4'-phosphopantetheinyl transferase superfamily protein [Bacillota bacterium]
MYLYLYHDENQLNKRRESSDQGKRSDFSELMVRKALKDYVKRQQLEMRDSDIDQVIIQKEEKGKPYFSLTSGDYSEKRLTTHYSVSHSGRWWGCLMAEERVGFDLEVYRENINYGKIAQRYFTEEEHEFISNAGLDAFFEVWVRKEAFVKYLGSGLAEGLDSFSVIERGCFLSDVIRKEETGKAQLSFKINSLEIQRGVKSAYCSESGNLMKGMITLG